MKPQNAKKHWHPEKNHVIASSSSSSRILNRAVFVKAQIVPVGRFEACGPGGAAALSAWQEINQGDPDGEQGSERTNR